MSAEEVGMETISNVKLRRKELSISAEKLAKLCTEQGFPINRSTLANIESGRRRDLSVSELVAFARALKTTPEALLPKTPCPNCSDLPPRGYRCNRCGKDGDWR